MRSILPLMITVLALVEVGSAELVYREVFPADNQSAADVGWRIHVGADARDASSGSAIAGGWNGFGGVPALNSGAPADADINRGLAYIKAGEEGTPFCFLAAEFPPSHQPLGELATWLHLDSGSWIHVVVQVDGDGDGERDDEDPWFVAVASLEDPEVGTEGLRRVRQDLGAQRWRPFPFEAGGRSGGGSLPAVLPDGEDRAELPPGAVLGVGFWSPARIGRPRFDTVEVQAAGLAEVAVGLQGRAQALLSRYAGEAVFAGSIAERYPHLRTGVDARGPRLDVAAWTPQLDVPVTGTVYHVHPDLGDDANDGLAPGNAFRSLERATRDLRAGDAVLIGPGAYYLHDLQLEDLAGTAEAPIYLRAEPRGAATVSCAWPDAAEGLVAWTDEGDGLWSAPYPTRPDGDPRAMGGFQADGESWFLFGMKSLADLIRDEVFVSGTWDRFSKDRGMPWPGYGFALEGGRCWLRTPGGRDPNGRRVVVASYATESTCLLRLDRSPHVVFDGLRFEGASDKAVKTQRAAPGAGPANSPHLVFRNCIIEWCRNGIGPDDHALIEWCEYHFPGYKRFADELKTRCIQAKLWTANPLFGFVKKYHGARTEGHLVTRPWSTPRDNRGVGPLHCEARYNFCHQTFDGDSLGGWSESRVHHGVYLYQYDNAVEFEAGGPSESRGNRWDHNLVIGCPYGAISHQDETAEPMGPQRIDHNVVIGNFPADYTGPGKVVYAARDSADDAWNPWILSKYLAPKADAIDYDHNLIWLQQAGGLLWAKDETAESRAKMRWRSNVIIIEEGQRDAGAYGFQAAANAWIAPTPRPDIQGEGGLHLTAISELDLRDPAALDLRPNPGSPLVDAGITLPGETVDDGAPDIGPFEVGTDESPAPGPDWPRPRVRAFNAAPPAALTGVEAIEVVLP